MDNIKKIILVLGVILLCGCSKIDGAWCSYTETFSSLVIKNSKYTYGTNLDNVDAISKDGSLEFKDDKVYLKDNDVTYYYKDKMLCTDLDCSSVLIKSKKKTC